MKINNKNFNCFQCAFGISIHFFFLFISCAEQWCDFWIIMIMNLCLMHERKWNKIEKSFSLFLAHVFVHCSQSHSLSTCEWKYIRLVKCECLVSRWKTTELKVKSDRERAREREENVISLKCSRMSFESLLLRYFVTHSSHIADSYNFNFIRDRTHGLFSTHLISIRNRQNKLTAVNNAIVCYHFVFVFICSVTYSLCQRHVIVPSIYTQNVYVGIWDVSKASELKIFVCMYVCVWRIVRVLLCAYNHLLWLYVKRRAKKKKRNYEVTLDSVVFVI